MKKIFIILLSLGLIGCETLPTQRHSKYKGIARVTAYNPYEKDKIRIRRGRRFVWRWMQWGRRTASGIRATQGVTCAAAKKFPIGTKVYFPQLNGVIGNGNFVVQDRGAGEQKFHTSNWFDIYCDNKSIMKKIQYGMPEWMEFQICQ